MADVVMPRLSDSMVDGTILKWLVEPGAEVVLGQELVEIETDKATMTYGADAAGPIELIAAVGDTLPIGAVIARIGPAGNGAAAVRAEIQVTDGSDRPTVAPAAAETGTAKGDVVRLDLTRTQQVVARRMAESRATVPDFTLTADIDMENAVALHSQLESMADQAPAPTYNDMVLRACALALREFPRVNGAYRDGRFELYSRINIGLAVAAQDALVVPTVFDADQHSLIEIAATTRALAKRVRSGEVTPPELSGGTFTLSNLGMYGVTAFTAVINPPQAAILAVGAIAPRAVPVGPDIVARHVMPVTLACDHRILYGADAAKFVGRIRALLESPAALLL
ncbi:MAG: hypothetical protein QOG68_1800 [Solirubrobacteraceae bacterium]|nr:hypothetical protein [Solirubrobacteraceae bacterium]